MNIKRVVSIPKELDHPELNEDYFTQSNDGLACAISDGASESYDSKTWSKVLCETFISSAKKTRSNVFFKEKEIKNFLLKSRLAFNSFYSKKNLSWSQEASFNRGCYSTIIGIIDHGKSIEILSVGDSVAIWQEKNANIKSFFIKNNYKFYKKPTLLCNISNNDKFFFDEFNISWSSITIQKNKIYNGDIFLITDALAERVFDLINQKKFSFAIKILKKDKKEFENWVLNERSSNLLKKDDTTVAWIKIND